MAPLDTTYSFYKQTYGGSAIPENEWVRYAGKASAYLERIDALSHVVPYGSNAELAWSSALCAVAEQYFTFDIAANEANEKSLSIGSVSISYDASHGGALDLTPAGMQKALNEAASEYLHIYRGLL